MDIDKNQQESTREFYNNYSSSQKNIGVNIRHRTIIRNAEKEGLLSTSKVLEIGCGIGTLTSLLAKKLTSGQLMAVDISDESVKQAQATLKKHPNLQFRVSDMSDFQVEQKFDYFIFPDVLEHIPVEQHENLFRVIAAHSHENSKVLINVPHPTFIEWLAINQPELMQIIDQPIHSDLLCKNAYKSGWILQSLNSYSLYHKEHDYQFIVFKRNNPYQIVPKKDKLKMKIEDIKSMI